MSSRKLFAASFLAAASLAAGPVCLASGTLYGLVFENAINTEKIATIDPSAGTVSTIGAGAFNCCLVILGVSTFDPNGNVFYTVGNFLGAPPEPRRLLGFDAVTGNLVHSPFLPTGNNYNFLEYDRNTDTLYVLFHETATTTEKVGTINPADGSLAAIGAGAANCCLVISGTSTLDPNSGIFYTVGTFLSEPSDPRRLLGFDVSTGGVVTMPFLPTGNNYNFLEYDFLNDVLYGLIFDNASMDEVLVTVNPASGVLTPVGSGISDCCLLINSQSTIDPLGGVFYTVGRRFSDDPNTKRILGVGLGGGALVSDPMLPSTGFNYNYIEFDLDLEPPVAEADIDVKFCSNPNAFNCKKNGVLPVTLFGGTDLDVNEINLASLKLCREDDLTLCTGSPINWSTADRGNPLTDLGAPSCAIVEGVEQYYLNLDGLLDLDVRFAASEVASLIGCPALSKGSVSVSLVLLGEFNDGAPLASTPVGDVGIDRLLVQNR